MTYVVIVMAVSEADSVRASVMGLSHGVVFSDFTAYNYSRILYFRRNLEPPV